MKLLMKSVRIKELFVIYHVKSLDFVKMQKKRSSLCSIERAEKELRRTLPEVMSNALSKKEEKQ